MVAPVPDARYLVWIDETSSELGKTQQAITVTSNTSTTDGAPFVKSGINRGFF